MKANEFIVEKKRKRKKPRWAAYGPGPYGGYGYYAGYSGDGGASGGDGGVGEASYPGNVGMMELAKFFQVADDQQKELFKKLLEKGKKGLAWKLVQDIVGVKLQGKEFDEDVISELQITDKDVQRILKDRLAIDAENGVDAMKLAIDKMSSMPASSYVKSQASQLMMLYKQSKMRIGGDYYRKLNKLAENFANESNSKYSLKNMFGDVKSLDNLSLDQLNKAIDGHVKLVGRKFRSQEGNSFKYDVKLSNGEWYIMHVVYVHGLIDAWLTDEENNKIPLSKFKKQDVEENFADGKVKGKSRPGRVKRSGASCSGSVTDLRKRAKNASGEKAKMYHWCANMKAGRNK